MSKFIADFRRMIGFLIISLVFTYAVSAQNPTVAAKINLTEKSSGAAAQNDDRLNAKNEFAVWSGFAPDIPRVFGGSRKSTFGAIGFRYSRRLATTENLAVKYQVDVIPLAVINYRTERLIQTAPNTFGYNRDRQTAYAAGITPVSFQLNFRRQTKVQPFITAGAGLLIFGRKIPDDRSPLRPNQVGRRLNFTPQAGGGVDFLTNDGRAYTVGFKFHHISNNSTANINPGFDQNFFYFGYTFKKF